MPSVGTGCQRYGALKIFIIKKIKQIKTDLNAQKEMHGEIALFSALFHKIYQVQNKKTFTDVYRLTEEQRLHIKTLHSFYRVLVASPC